MRVLSLFSGIGGIDLGLERAGHTVIAQSEIDPYCCRVLAKHWPDVPNLGDVTTIDWTEHLGLGVELVCGGYPCQPFSLAGSRQGEKDPRHLWPYMANAIRILRPDYAVLENVPGHRSLGFDSVLGDLAESGYDCRWDCIPACAVGAPHRRDRVWIVAYTGDARRSQRRRTEPIQTQLAPVERHGETLADTEGIAQREPADETFAVAGSRNTWALPRRRSWWAVEPDVGRVAHGVPRRVDRLRGLGNAVVPQVAEHIGRMIPVAA